MKVTAAIIASVKASTSLDICEADYQGINERVLACPGGRINIISAEYGRPGDDRETCCANKRKCWVKPGTTCTANALDWVKTKCEGESECTLFGNMNGVLGDPCSKRHKFLNVQYECDYETPVVTASFCEAQLDNRTNNIVCANPDEVITVKSAAWGRQKDAYCCPYKQDGKCLANQCSGGSTDATEIMGARCDGQASCSWEDDIANGIRDPCSDVFKYMTVDYECAVPTTPAPALAMNDMREAEFEGDVAETGNSNCANLMTAAYNYFSQLTSQIQTEESHKSSFHNSRTNSNQSRTFESRINQFQHNMNKWGSRFDSYGCYCNPETTVAIQNFANNISSRGTDDFDAVKQALENTEENMNCDVSFGMGRKLGHAEQILQGKRNSKRHRNWLQNGGTFTRGQ